MSESAEPWRGRRLHFVGVGGAGLSAYARAASALGAEVSGSDVVRTPFLERLAADGVLQAHIGHRAQNVPARAGVEVIYSSAVEEANVERQEARQRGLAERPRADLLAELTTLKRTIAVAGTHGKTTTAAMLVHALRGAGLDPAWLIGGSPGGGLENASWAQGEWLVAEADESDRSMLSLSLEIAVLTNVELDHHATFATLAEVRDAFRSFLARAGRAIVVWNQPELLALAPERGSARAATAGREAQGANGGPACPVEVVPYSLAELALAPGGSRFRWHGVEVALHVPGAHNALNATAALEAASLAGAEDAPAVAALGAFGGAGRRFELLGRSPAGALVYDDYAHHPSEVAATLQAARTFAPRRLIAVFQPHLYSRTAMLALQFGATLAEADVTVVLDVYPARERAEDHPGVSGLLIARAAAQAAAGRPVYWLPTFAAAEPVLRGLLQEGDLCLVMGAGNVDELGRALVAG